MKNRKDTRKITACWILVFWCAFSSVASAQIKSVQYWFDNDFSGRSALSITENQSLQITELNANSLPAGIHQLHIRAKDNERWSVVHSRVFYKLPVSTSGNTLTGYEYWIDNGFAQRISGTLSGASGIVSEFDTGDLPAGIHLLHVRAKDSGGHYSPVHSQVFYKQSLHAGANAIAGYEYWWDNGFGDRISVATNEATLTITEGFDLKALSPGIHVFYIRAKDSRGHLSGVHARTFYVNSLTAEGENLIAACRYWYDNDFDGQLLTTFPQTVAAFEMKEKLTLPAGFNIGEKHAFHIQFQTAGGQWSVATTDSFKLVPLFSGEEFELLKAFYRSTNGDDWLNTQAGIAVWDTTAIAGVRDWYGLEFEEGSVSRFNLTKNNLTGTLPVAVLAGFPRLQTLTVDSNRVFLEEALPVYLSVNIKAQEFDCGSILVDKTAALNLPIYDISRYAHASGTFSTNNRFSIYVNDTYQTRVYASNNTVSLSKTYTGNLNGGDRLKLVQYEGDAAGSVYTYTVTFGTPVINVDSSSEIRLYPNPVSDGFRIGGVREPATLTLIDVNGAIVLSQPVNDGEYVSVSSLAKGLYIVKLQTGNGTLERKLIKM